MDIFTLPSQQKEERNRRKQRKKKKERKEKKQKEKRYPYEVLAKTSDGLALRFIETITAKLSGSVHARKTIVPGCMAKQPLCTEAKKMKTKKNKCNHKNKKKQKTKKKKKKNDKGRSTALGIRMWSPTILLTQPTDA